jgi:predicted PurR-regulated permease PerM
MTLPPGGWRDKPTGPFLILVGTVLVFAFLFYRVVEPMILPLFLAAAFAIMAQPMQNWLVNRLGGRDYLAATLMTVALILGVAGPLAAGGALAFREVWRSVVRADLTHGRSPIDLIDPQKNPDMEALLKRVDPWYEVDRGEFRNLVVARARELGSTLTERVRAAAKEVPGYLFASVIFIVGLFFFLADGRRIAKGWENLSPMDPEHDRVIRAEFLNVCRAVMWGTVIAAMTQGIVFGLGMWVIELIFRTGIGGWIFLLSITATAFALIPFLGAAAVWGATAAYLFWAGQTGAAIALVIWGASVVSTIDNVIKIYIIGDSAKLHPLLVVVSVFGGLQMSGIIGIFVGPIVAAVLFALLRILRLELIGPPPEEPAKP